VSLIFIVVWGFKKVFGVTGNSQENHRKINRYLSIVFLVKIL